jgi:pyrimidine operon attenuation protein / uracil phosphoribosyltransferase
VRRFSDGCGNFVFAFHCNNILLLHTIYCLIFVASIFIMGNKNYILDKATADRKIRRMALEVAERNHNEQALVLIGIKDNGSVIARKIAAHLADVFAGTVQVLELQLDKKHPGDVHISANVDFTGKNILLIDDVANSGRTMLYALKPLLSFHPKKIETLALVERTHKSFPVEVDYTGLSVATTPDQHIYVEVVGGEVEGAWVG